MRYSTSERYNCVVYQLKGNFMGGPEVGDFIKEVKENINNGKKNIVMDLSGVHFMNSSGLGTLINIYTTNQNNDGEMVISGASKNVKSLLVVTKLVTVFDHYETLDEALDHFNQ